MTKEQFKHDMMCGLGSAIVELIETEEKEKYREIVMWGCTHELAYDVQCEGSRSAFLYELISAYEDVIPFLIEIEEQMEKCMYTSSHWEFYQHCFVLSHFASEGNEYAIYVLNKMYQELYHYFLSRKKAYEQGIDEKKLSQKKLTDKKVNDENASKEEPADKSVNEQSINGKNINQKKSVDRNANGENVYVKKDMGKQSGKNDILIQIESMEALCVAIVIYTDRPACKNDDKCYERYKKIVHDLGNLMAGNSCYSAEDFLWFQSHCEEELGKRRVNAFLNAGKVTDEVKVYAESLEKYRGGRKQQEKQAAQESQMAENSSQSNFDNIVSEDKTDSSKEIYEALKEGKKSGYQYIFEVRKLMHSGKMEEVEKIADYYRREKKEKLRLELLRILANGESARLLNVNQLISDSKSSNKELSEVAFDALSHIRNNQVREYALRMSEVYGKTQTNAKNKTDAKHKTDAGSKNIISKNTASHNIAKAVSLLAMNYEEEDYDRFVDMVKEIPVSYEDGWWHMAYWNTFDLIKKGGIKKKPRELLEFMYRNTLCSCCRETLVKEMGRRRMITEKMWKEMQYDSNSDIRDYAEKKRK